MTFYIKAWVRHLFGYHTPVLELKLPGRWCYICGRKLE